MLFSKCQKETPVDPFEHPTDLDLSTEWHKDEVSLEKTVIWYRINVPADVTKLNVEWTDLSQQATDQNFSAEIQVSAYALDGKTAYFEASKSGYGADMKQISLSSTDGLLLKVESLEHSYGSFGIKVFESNTIGDLVPIILSLGEGWNDFQIELGEILAFEVPLDQAPDILRIVWAEYNSPETGYTADIKGSVYKEDGETAYKDLGNGKSIVGKDKSHSDNPKEIQVIEGQSKLLILISLNDAAKPGSFGIKVY